MSTVQIDVAAISWRVVKKKLIVGDGCWGWRGHLNMPNGYPQVPVAGRPRLLHRVIYSALVGPIPDGLQLDHLCRNHMCSNPSHLEPVTPRENVRRGVSRPAQHARQTHCKFGHEFTPENTHVRRNGARNCRECNRIACRNRSRR